MNSTQYVALKFLWHFYSFFFPVAISIIIYGAVCNRFTSMLVQLQKGHLSFQVEHQNSKTLPLRVTIFGNDAKEHQYLVKFGEDLRQDQRLEQLFILMNKILHQDPACRQRSLSIATYQVLRNTGLQLLQFQYHFCVMEETMREM